MWLQSCDPTKIFLVLLFTVTKINMERFPTAEGALKPSMSPCRLCIVFRCSFWWSHLPDWPLAPLNSVTNIPLLTLAITTLTWLANHHTFNRLYIPDSLYFWFIWSAFSFGYYINIMYYYSYFLWWQNYVIIIMTCNNSVLMLSMHISVHEFMRFNHIAHICSGACSHIHRNLHPWLPAYYFHFPSIISIHIHAFWLSQSSYSASISTIIIYYVMTSTNF